MTDGSIFSAVKYFLQTYAPNDCQDFKKLNRDHAWENKILVKLRGYPLLQNRPPGAVSAINKVYARAASALKKKLYRYKSIGSGKYCVTNTSNDHRYKFTLRMGDCDCVDSVTNIYKIPCIHSIYLILRLGLSWKYLDLSVRRNKRNSLINPTDCGWKILGAPKSSEDVISERFWEITTLSEPASENDMGSDSPDSKEDFASSDDIESFQTMAGEDQTFDLGESDWGISELPRLPTGKTVHRLTTNLLRQLHDSAGRLKETFFNIQTAFRVSSNQAEFVSGLANKFNALQAVHQKLSEAESIMMATTGRGGSYPVISNVEVVRASNKLCAAPQQERRPEDVRLQREKRKRQLDAAIKNLDAVPTPLVEANRPNKKRKSEASRHQRNYRVATKKKTIPKALHPSLKSSVSQMQSPKR